MAVKHEILEKSRLGRVLVARNLITEEQLQSSLAQHYESGERLGEILVARGLVDDRDIRRALKQQKRTRYAAAVVAVVVTPLQPMMALAAGSAGAAAPLPKTAATQSFKSGLQPLDEQEMAQIGGQGFGDDFQQLYALVNAYDQEDIRAGKLQDEEEEVAALDGVKVLGGMGKVFFPIANVLDAEIEMEGVYYDPSRIKPLVTEDGRGFNVNLPSRIERLSFIDIRPAGSSGATLGSIHMEGIRFHENASLVVRPN